MNTAAKPVNPSAVPWYRQTWFCIACIVVFPPALIPVLLTGPLYYRKRGQLLRYSKTARIFLFSLAILTALYFMHSAADG
ncbi:MAG TPA: hypothetical protein VMD56_08785 [Steroidobacteraceae bacterium]|nr:hypothetical protein [Steroidobacteraceae bacterium]